MIVYCIVVTRHFQSAATTRQRAAWYANSHTCQHMYRWEDMWITETLKGARYPHCTNHWTSTTINNFNTTTGPPQDWVHWIRSLKSQTYSRADKVTGQRRISSTPTSSITDMIDESFGHSITSNTIQLPDLKNPLFIIFRTTDCWTCQLHKAQTTRLHSSVYLVV